jgi:hypothetical protein
MPEARPDIERSTPDVLAISTRLIGKAGVNLSKKIKKTIPSQRQVAGRDRNPRVNSTAY